MAEPLFEPSEITDAFLGAVDAGRAARAEQGIVDVAGDDQLAGGQGGGRLEPVGLQDRLQGGGEGLAGFLEGITQGEGDA